MSYWPVSLPDMESKDVMPDVMEAPLVGVTRNGCFSYYVAPTIVWYLDYLKKIREIRPDFTVEMPWPDVKDRFGIFVVDKEHEEAYVKGLEPYKKSCGELRAAMRMCIHAWELEDFSVNLLLDFDRKVLLSYYPEPMFFEEYVPEGWSAEYRPLREDDFPPGAYFWIDEDGKNLFEESCKESEV